MDHADADAFTTRDIVYREIGGRSLQATLYLPAGSGPFPALVDVHGGAWVHGDRSKNAPLCRLLASSGVIVMSVDQRKPPDTYPASVEDVNAAIRWLKRHAGSFGGRPDRVGAIGGSSGGHLVLLNALLPDAYRGGDIDDAHSAALRLVVACWPIVDPWARYAMAEARGLAKLKAAHDAYWVPPETMRAGNPQRIVAERRFTALPPVLIVQGTNDANMTPDMIEDFVAGYRAADGTLDIAYYEDQPHDFIFADPAAEASGAAMTRIRDWVLGFAWP